MTADRAGYRLLPHTADVIVEAWGEDRDACFEQAVAGLVGVFASTGDTPAGREHTVRLDGDDPEDLLVELLDEVLFLLDARAEVVATAAVRTHPGGLEATFGLVPVAEVDVVGAVPKAVTYHRLSVGPVEGGGWRSRVTVDV